jgi:hypothetical protein
MIVIRYADDTVVGFQREHEARAFLDDLRERMRKFASRKRRGQTARINWERWFIRFVARFSPPIGTIRPLPCHRFDARTRGRSPVRWQRTPGSVRGARNPRPYRDPELQAT